jgi:hypothetical protein
VMLMCKVAIGCKVEVRVLDLRLQSLILLFRSVAKLVHRGTKSVHNRITVCEYSALSVHDSPSCFFN